MMTFYVLRIFIFAILIFSNNYSYAQGEKNLPEVALPGLEQSQPDKPDITGDFSDIKLFRNIEIISVIDPLTLQASKSTLISLTCLDFPDFNPYDPGPFSQSAVQILRDLLLGKQVLLYHTRDKKKGRSNRMGHSIYHVEYKDKNQRLWVQGLLVRLGLARVRSTKSNPEMIDQLYSFEKQAREEKLGLWAMENYQIQTPEQSFNNLHGFHIVQGKVENAIRRQNYIYLNFGKNWRDDFTVRIKAIDARHNFKNLDPLSLKGKTIRARGWITEYNGPLMDIDHQERIEIIK